jgi:hypothetical protein
LRINRNIKISVYHHKIPSTRKFEPNSFKDPYNKLLTEYAFHNFENQINQISFGKPLQKLDDVIYLAPSSERLLQVTSRRICLAGIL